MKQRGQKGVPGEPVWFFKETPGVQYRCWRLRLVGAPGFEPGAPCTPCRCATWLRYAPTLVEYHTEFPASRRLT